MQESQTEKIEINWNAIEKSPRFQKLHRTKTQFLAFLMCFALIYFFCLPISTAYFQPLLITKVWGVINIGLLFALSQFVVAWGIAIIYTKRANHDFDKQAKNIQQESALNQAKK